LIATEISNSWGGYITGSGIISSSTQISTAISNSWGGYITGSGILSSSTQIATEISNSWGGYITGSGILSSSTQIATEISNSWGGYITGSGILSSSTQIATEISNSWGGYITGSGILSSSTQIATEISNSWGGYITGSGILSSSTQIATEISNSWGGYITGSGIISSSTSLTEFSFDSIVVSDINTTFDVATFSDPSTPQSFEVRNDSGILWDDVNSMYNSSVTASSIDQDISTIASFDVSNTVTYAPNNAFNIIWDFNTPTIVSEFRHSFDFDKERMNLYTLPHNVYVYGKNTAFDLSGIGPTDGTLLAEGARPGQGGMPATPGGGPLIWSGPSSNPTSIYGIGENNNLNRTSSIRETSLTSSFRYYRIRYEGTINSSIGAQFSSNNDFEIGIKEVTPVTRSFVDKGTSISASNGVLNVTQIICNNIIGTSSFSTLANSAVSACYTCYITGS
jgi:galactitol-specific phosphotransferase system IIB component